MRLFCSEFFNFEYLYFEGLADIDLRADKWSDELHLARVLNTADCMHLGEDSLGPESFADGKLDDDLTFITRLLSSLFVPNVTRQELKVCERPIFFLTLHVRS